IFASTLLLIPSRSAARSAALVTTFDVSAVPALIASGLALPARRITVNLAPADLPERRKSLRFADRARTYGSDWRHPARCTEQLHRPGRTRPRRLDSASCRRIAGCDRRQRARTGFDLSRSIRC